MLVACEVFIKHLKFAISNHRSLRFLNAHFVGYNKASAGYYLSRRTIKVFEPLRPLYQTTHLLKIKAPMLLTYYSISCAIYHFASEKCIPGKWWRQECDYISKTMNNRFTVATDRLACSRSASSRYRRFFSWRIKRSMWTLHQAFADRSTSQVYLWAIMASQEVTSSPAAYLLLNFMITTTCAQQNLRR